MSDVHNLRAFIFAASIIYWVLILVFLMWLLRRVSSLRERISSLEYEMGEYERAGGRHDEDERERGEMM